jgi:hypothetical protein
MAVFGASVVELVSPSFCNLVFEPLAVLVPLTDPDFTDVFDVAFFLVTACLMIFAAPGVTLEVQYHFPLASDQL